MSANPAYNLFGLGKPGSGAKADEVKKPIKDGAQEGTREGAQQGVIQGLQGFQKMMYDGGGVAPGGGIIKASYTTGSSIDTASGTPTGGGGGTSTVGGNRFASLGPANDAGSASAAIPAGVIGGAISICKMADQPVNCRNSCAPTVIQGAGIGAESLRRPTFVQSAEHHRRAQRSHRTGCCGDITSTVAISILATLRFVSAFVLAAQDRMSASSVVSILTAPSI